MSQPPRQKSLQCLTTLLSASENWTYFTCLAEKIWKASIFHSKHLQKKLTSMKVFPDKKQWGEERMKSVSHKVQIYYVILWGYFCQSLFRNTQLWDYFHTILPQGKPALPTAAALLIPRGVREGGAGKDTVLHPQQLPRSHRNLCSPCAAATEALGTPQTFLIPYKLIFPEWFCFPWTFPIQTTLPAISLFSVPMGRGRLVFMEQELSLQEHPCAEEWPKHLPWGCWATEKAEPLLRNDRHRWALVRQNQGQVLLFT